MPNLAKVIKEEISRLSRKEAHNATATLAKNNATLRSRAAALRKEVSGLKAEQRRLSAALSFRTLSVISIHAALAFRTATMRRSYGA